MASFHNRLITVAPVVENEEVAAGLYSLLLESNEIAALAKPGQFVNVLTSAGWDPLLRRPMSIGAVEGQNIKLLYKVVGRGTSAMAQWNAGDTINLLGPLGNGWDLAVPGFPVIVGGGAGIAPVYYLHRELRRTGTAHHLIMGARTSQGHFLQHNPEGGISLATDDGSLGTAGTVLDALSELVESPIMKRESISLYGCGPPAMLRALVGYSARNDLNCQLALEEMMACGIGLCQGCNVEMHLPGATPEHSYHQRYSLACIDGPVFKAEELSSWHE